MIGLPMMNHIMVQRRFAPFFWTQFFGAFNDNVFKNALVIMIAFQLSSQKESGFLINLAGGLFILPFILFSPLSGQLCDKLPKTRLIKIIKFSEIIIMLVAGYGFITSNIPFLITALFFMGMHSTFFGPAKYSLIPQLLEKSNIVKGNAWIEMGTFIAILMGTILGGVLIHHSYSSVAIGGLIIAILGFITSMFIPKTPATNPYLKINLNPLEQMKSMISVSRKQKIIFISILANSWFWLFGATFLSQFPTYVKFTLHGSEILVTALFALFTLSLAFGSVCYSKLTRSHLELGLVPFGLIGMSLAGVDIGLIDYSLFSENNYLANIFDFFKVHTITALRIILDVFIIGLCGSLFIVPLFAVMQIRSDEKSCSQIIASNNVFNSIFMVGSSIISICFYSFGYQTEDIFFSVSFMTIIVGVILFSIEKEFLKESVKWLKKTRFLVQKN